MVGIFLLMLMAAIAWLSGLQWVVAGFLILLVLLNVGIFLTVGGVSKSRQKKQKYHPV